jgi:hypothetical protein
MKERRLVEMEQETGLTTVTPSSIGIYDPEGQLEMAIRAAKALSKVIAQKKKPVIINGEQYLEFEDWQTLGQFDGVSVRTGEAEPVEIDGVKGAKAKAFLVNNHTGEIIGGAEAYCMRDEDKWGTRPKYEWRGEGKGSHRVKVGDEPVPWFQLASMAQTRAGAKALRNKESWIAVLGGYKPTPAEEMTEGTVSPAVKERRTVDDEKHWCQEHNTAWFKRGKMKSYAHPIEGTDPVEWCHEPSRPQPETPKEEPQEAPEPEVESYINLDWLRESMKTLQEKGITAYSNKNVVSYLNQITGQQSTKVSDAVKLLTKEQAEKLSKDVADALEMA